MAASSWILTLRASVTDGVFVRSFLKTDQETTAYRSVPLTRNASVDAAILQTAFIRDNGFEWYLSGRNMTSA